MKKTCKQAAILLTMILLLLLGSCGEREKETEPAELHVFAAASMTEVLTELGNTYMKKVERATSLYPQPSSRWMLFLTV